jgi:ATP-dependent Clp protease ATP-binding subunit ClpB
VSLTRRNLSSVITDMTFREYRKYIEKDAAFERRFAQVLVNEPSVPETINILRGICEKYAVHHGVRILDGALISAATLAHRYFTARRLPDSAIDLVDEACARYGLTLSLSLSAVLIPVSQRSRHPRNRSRGHRQASAP